MTGAHLVALFLLATACGTQGGPGSDASAEADGPQVSKVCDPCKLPWACTDSTHWAAMSVVQCPSSACPADCTHGAWCTSGPVEACAPNETCDVTAPKDAGSPCVPVDAGVSD